jgi:hypothetical protein
MKIAFVFRAVEQALARLTEGPGAKARGWHTFVSGSVAGYLVMGGTNKDYSLKKNINMCGETMATFRV